VDITDDGFFSLMNEDGDMRDDLKLGENCTCSTPDTVRELIAQAESTGERVVV